VYEEVELCVASISSLLAELLKPCPPDHPLREERSEDCEPAAEPASEGGRPASDIALKGAQENQLSAGLVHLVSGQAG